MGTLFVVLLLWVVGSVPAALLIGAVLRRSSGHQPLAATGRESDLSLLR